MSKITIGTSALHSLTFDVEFARFSSLDPNTASSDTFFQWTSGQGHRFTAIGTGIISDPSGNPFGGVINSIEIDLWPTSANSVDIEITDLDVALTDIAQPFNPNLTNMFWREILDGSTTIEIAQGSSVGNGDEIAGDFVIHDTQTIFYASDDTIAASTLIQWLAMGDGKTISNGLVNGGNDSFTGAWANAFGDVFEVIGSGVLVGGNDTTQMSGTMGTFTNMTNAGDANIAKGTSTVLGGDDIIDARGIISTTFFTPKFVGDVVFVSESARVIGGNDVIYGHATKGNSIFGDVDSTTSGTVVTGGNDTLFGGSGIDYIYGDSGFGSGLIIGGDDTIYGGGGLDILVGNGGDDLIYGGDDRDFVGGNNGDDRIYGGAGNDELRGDEGNDRIFGDLGNDTIEGGNGNDRLYHGGGTSRLTGGSGDDYVRAGDGIAIYYGGDGVDYLSYYDSPDSVSVNLTTNSITGSWGNGDAISSFEGVSTSKTGDDTVTGTAGDNLIRTYGGEDKVYAGSGGDKVYLGSGDDYVRVGGGVESFYGGSGSDDYISYVDSSGGVRIDLAADTISGSWGSNDVIDGFESAGGSKTGADKMYGTSGANRLKAYGGDDSLWGRSGDDKLYGGSGEDRFDGGHGADQLWGGSGDDVFHFDRGEGDDVVRDFADDEDTIQFDNFSALTDAAGALAFATESGGNVLFDFGADGTLLVLGTTKAALLNDVEVV